MSRLRLAPRRVAVLATHLIAASALILVIGESAQAATIMINNGLAPPNPANVIDDDTYYWYDVHVRNVECPPGWPAGNADDPCPFPGAPTEVAVVNAWNPMLAARRQLCMA